MEATSMSINRVANQDDVVHIHTMEYYVAIKKNENNAICSDMDRSGDCHTM